MKIIINMLSILFISNYVYAQWEYQESGVQDDLIDVCFVDSLNGWIIGDNSTILATNDGGMDWDTQISPDTNRVMKKIQFVDRDNGFIIGDNGLALKTTNNGLNWEKVSIDSFNYSDLSFISNTTGWLSGWKETPQSRTAVILKTEDGGDTWINQLEIFSEHDLYNSVIFMSIAFLNDSIGWALGGSYAGTLEPTFVYFTSDCGDNWNIIGVWESSPINNLRIINRDTLWAGGLPFIFSNNGGIDWLYTEDENQRIQPQDIAPINNLKGWAIHYDHLTKENKIMYTSDEGQHWQEKLDLTENPAWALTVIDNYLWIVGDNGLIIKKDLLVSSIEIKNDLIIKYFELYQNYPNPFNPVTKIKYELLKQSRIKLSIFDINGKRITDLVNDIQTAGTYEISFHSEQHNLSSGIYIYKIETGDYSQSKKFIYVK